MPTVSPPENNVLKLASKICPGTPPPWYAPLVYVQAFCGGGGGASQATVAFASSSRATPATQTKSYCAYIGRPVIGSVPIWAPRTVTVDDAPSRWASLLTVAEPGGVQTSSTLTL